MAYTYVRAGQIITAGLMNDIALVGQVVFKASRDATQSVSNNATPQVSDALQWDTISLDDLGGWVSGTPTRYTAVRDGWYTLSGSCGFNSTNPGAGTVRGAAWFLNGALLTGGHSRPHANIPANLVTMTAEARTISIELGIGDYVELTGYQNTGGVLGTATGSIKPYAEIAFTRPSG